MPRAVNSENDLLIRRTSEKGIVRLNIAANTDIGNVRGQNQDAYAVGEFADGSVWAVVCDGMGGAAGGSTASSTAVEIIAERIKNSYRKDIKPRSVRNLLVSATETANAVLFEMSREEETLAGMGTTVVAVVVTEDTAYIAHAGDSRAYLLTDKTLMQITKDHSVVQAMVENGELTPEQAKLHPRKNVITRALGVDESISVDFSEEPIQPGDILMICTDGLSNFVDAENIQNILENCSQADCSQALIARANERGGGDNITVVTVSC